MVKRWARGALFILFTSCKVAFADDFLVHHSDAEFGPEFTFSSAKVWDNPELRKQSLHQMLYHLKMHYSPNDKAPTIESVPDPKTGRKNEAFLVTYDDGFWLRFSQDEGAVEIQSKPETIETWRKLKDRLQRDIFESAMKAGMTPAVGIADNKNGGGHISISANVFDENPGLLTSLSANYANHPERIWIFQGTPLAAKPLRTLSQDLQDTFWRIVGFDYPAAMFSSGVLSRQILSHVHGIVPDWIIDSPKWKDQEINLSRVPADPLTDDFPVTAPEERRVEVRSFGAQKSMDHFLLEIDFLNRLMEYLRRNPESQRAHIPTITQSSALTRFKRDLEKLGINDEPWRPYMPKTISQAYKKAFEEINLLSKDQINTADSMQTPEGNFNGRIYSDANCKNVSRLISGVKN